MMNEQKRWLSALLAAGVATSSASAFFFPGWPGSGVPQLQSLIPPGTPSEGNPPSGNPPVTTTIPGQDSHPSTGTDNSNGGGSSPSTTPEPGTLISAILGLSALGTGLLIRKRK